MEVKEKLREHKHRELENAIAASGALMRGILAIEDESADRYNGMIGRCMTEEEFSFLMGHLVYLDGKKAAMREEKHTTDKRVDALRRELLGLTMELKMFEKLKFRALEVARTAVHRKEQKMMDALALRSKER
jgi:flagellar export protein FliJ